MCSHYTTAAGNQLARMPGIEPGRADWRPANAASGAAVLPLHYIRFVFFARVSGIEPDPADWMPAYIAPKAIVLPLHYTRKFLFGN